MKFRLNVLTLLLATATATAAPAPWYLWQSRLTGTRVCAQILAGDWQQVGGPFADSRCETRATRAAAPLESNAPANQPTAIESAP